ncbi:sensor histidine kinase [Paenibacillus tarimensis]
MRHKMFNPHSVGVKVFAFYLASMLIVIAVLGYLSYVKSAQLIESKIGGVALQTVQQTAKRIESILAEYENRTLMIFSNRELQKQILDLSGDTFERLQINNRNYKFFSDLINTKNDTMNIYILSETGNSFRYSQENTQSVYNSFSNRYEREDWYRSIKEADGHSVYFGIRPSFISDDSGPEDVPRFIVGRAIKHLEEFGEIIAIMIYEINANDIMQILSEIDFNGSGSVYLVDGSNRIVADAGGGSLMTTLDIPEAGRNGGTVHKDKGGQETLFVYSTLEQSEWRLVGMADANQFMKDSRDIGRYTFYLGIAAGIVAILLAFYVARAVYRPLYTMVRVMRKAKEGDLSIRIRNTRKDEFGILYTQFNGMISNLKELIDEIYVQKLLQKELQLRMMGSQINAHFLYNTLNSVHWIARIHKVEEISTMVFGLSKYLRLSLNEGRDEVTVREVMELIDSYLSIQKVRYQGKFVIELQADEELMECKVLKYIFQPLVENAIYHGLEKKNGKGRLQVRFRNEEGCLRYEVTDDGIGVEPCKLEQLRQMAEHPDLQTDRHFALRNIAAQIRLVYGPAYRLFLKSELGQGTTAGFTIPLQKK